MLGAVQCRATIIELPIACTVCQSMELWHVVLGQVFGSEATQDQIFEDTRQLIRSCCDGYNVCVFAYGQTGAGKTHTMEGSKEEPGVNYRALQ
jgi:hypothetical protein